MTITSEDTVHHEHHPRENANIPPSPTSQPQVDDYRRHFVTDCLRHVDTLLGCTVLVVGCGSGMDCTSFINLGVQRLLAIDLDASIGCDFHHALVHYVRAGAEAMPFRGVEFDLVFSVATMEHIRDIEGAFSEMVRVTKVGGLVYCVAAPLWNSREGHHQFGLFPDYPWIHLRLSQAEVLSYCRERGIAKGSYDVSFDVAFMFSDYFNFLSAKRYLDVCARLPVSHAIENSLWLEPDDRLTPAILAELETRGYTREELLAVSHKFVARK